MSLHDFLDIVLNATDNREMKRYLSPRPGKCERKDGYLTINLLRNQYIPCMIKCTNDEKCKTWHHSKHKT
jgi:hypothetical protein